MAQRLQDVPNPLLDWGKKDVKRFEKIQTKNLKFFNSFSTKDERMAAALGGAILVDARPVATAVATRLAGAGSESLARYGEVRFIGLANVRALRESHLKLGSLCSHSTDTQDWLRRKDSSSHEGLIFFLFPLKVACAPWFGLASADSAHAGWCDCGCQVSGHRKAVCGDSLQ